MRRLVALLGVVAAASLPAAASASTPPGLAAKLRHQTLEARAALALANKVLLTCPHGLARTQGVQPLVRLPVCTKAGLLRLKVVAILDTLRSGKAAGSQVQTLLSRAQALGPTATATVLPAPGGNG